MTKRFALAVLILGIAGSGAYATVDHLTSACQAIYCPNRGEIAVVPVHFLTHSTSAEAVIETVCTPNNMDLRTSATTSDCNLISLYGIKIDAEEKAADSKEDSVVTLDLSKLAVPAAKLYPPDENPSEETVIQVTLKCVCMTAGQRCGWKRVKVVIRADNKEVEKKWKKYERVYVLKEKKKAE
jgi:hypothetical protein